MNEADTVQILAVAVGILAVAYLFLKLSLRRTMQRIDRLIGDGSDDSVLHYKIEGKAKATVDLSAMKGQHGTVLTALRPYGTVRINGETFHARTEGGFLHKEAQVSVLSSENEDLVVCEADTR